MLIFVVYHRGKFSGKGKEEILFLPPLFERSLRKDRSVKMSNFKIEPAMKIIYDFLKDKELIKILQECSLKNNTLEEKTSGYTFKPYLIGSKEWINAIKNGEINKYIIKGKIIKVYNSGHNDFPQFDIIDKHGNLYSFVRYGNEKSYKENTNVVIELIKMKRKNGQEDDIILKIIEL